MKNNNKVTSVDFDVWVEAIFRTKLRYTSSFEDDQIVTDNRIQLPIKKNSKTSIAQMPDWSIQNRVYYIRNLIQNQGQLGNLGIINK
jgi:hypothetical protein